ncbi:NlpC/P60 family protein [Pseudonocardia petroleophila]|uniref:NlpC/P60 family protein n=1 Tax=Pseudonocardia petroleophila TaxID=37331 RepID=UPI0031E04237
MRAALGALVLAAIVAGLPAAVPPGIVPGAVPLVVAPAADRVEEIAAVAVDAALAQLGLPYEWGGDGPAAGDTGFDCSGLTHHAYAVAGIGLPRTAHTQYYAGPGVPPDAPLQPGDLVFYGVPERVYHVGLYLGDGTMVNAPSKGRPVQVARYRYPGDEYLGATRPAALGDPALIPPRPAPAPAPIPVPEVFEAPRAALPDGLRDRLPAGDPGPVLAALDSAPGAEVPAPSVGGGTPAGALLDDPAARPADAVATLLGEVTAVAAPVAGVPTSSTGRVRAGVDPALPVDPVAPGAVAPVDPTLPVDPAASVGPAAPGGPAAAAGPAADPAAPVAPAAAARPATAPGGPAAAAGPAAPGGPPPPAAAPRTEPDTVVATRDHRVELGPVAPGPDGLPSGVGRVGTLLRVPAELVAALEVGDTVEVTADGVTEDRLVVEIGTGVDADEVAGSGAPTTLLAPSEDGWTLVRLA